jgi:hypothetical protein
MRASPDTRAARVRRARPDDAEALAALGRETFIETFGHLYSAADLRDFLAEAHTADRYRAWSLAPAFALSLVSQPPRGLVLLIKKPFPHRGGRVLHEIQ